MKRLLPLLILLLLLCGAAAADGLSVTVGGEAISFTENILYISAPEPGELTLTLVDGADNVWRTIAAEVPGGDSTLVWDGLGWNEERIPLGEYTLQIRLASESGALYTAETSLRAGRSSQALRFALPSADTLYRGSRFFIELNLVRAGRVVMTAAAADAPDVVLLTLRKRLGSDGVFRWAWDGGDLPAGRYTLRLWAEENPAYVRAFDLTITDDAPPELPVGLTGSVLPETLDDAAVWAAMQQPSVVAALHADTDHQTIFAEPDRHSAALGTIHGNTQSVEVLALTGDGWAQVAAWNHERGARVIGYVPSDVLQTVTPAAHVGVLIDKRTQTMAVYMDGKRLDAFPISTGLMVTGKLFRETPAGAFLTSERILSFEDDGYRYTNPIRYDGGNLLHMLGKKTTRGLADYSIQAAELGKKASHGCVRLPRMPGAGGLNGYWLWTHLPYRTRVLILDDPSARAAELAFLGQNADPEPPVTQPADCLVTPVPADAAPSAFPTPEAVPSVTDAPSDSSFIVVDEADDFAAATIAPPETSDVLRLTLGGDAVLGVREGWWKREDSLVHYLETEGMAWPFGGLQEIFAADDMTFINLECVLKANRSGEKTGKQYRFRGLPAWTEALHAGSVEQVNIANNHYIDYDDAGKKATRDALTGAGIPFSGYSRTYIWEQNGHRIGFAGCRETIFLQRPGIIAQETQALREAGCEVVIYTCHWGVEYSPTHNDTQLRMAQAAADAGVDLVVGGHPHVVQGIDSVDGTVVLWSLGNLMFGGTIDLTTYDAALASVELRFDEGSYVGMYVTYVPILTSSRAAEGINDYHPVLAEGGDRERILALIQTDSTMPVTERMWFPAR